MPELDQEQGLYLSLLQNIDPPVLSTHFVSSHLFPLSSRDWFTVISLIVYVTDICFIAL